MAQTRVPAWMYHRNGTAELVTGLGRLMAMGEEWADTPAAWPSIDAPASAEIKAPPAELPTPDPEPDPEPIVIVAPDTPDSLIARLRRPRGRPRKAVE